MSPAGATPEPEINRRQRLSGCPSSPSLPLSGIIRAGQILARLSVAFACVACALMVRKYALADWDDHLAYITFYPAVTVAAIFGGAFGGAVATLMAVAVVHEWVAPVHAPSGPAGLATFVVACALVSGLAGARQRAVTAEAALRRTVAQNPSQARITALFDQTAAGIAQLDSSGRFTLVNDRGGTFFGEDPEALLGRRLVDFVAAADRPPYQARLARLAQAGVAFDDEIRIDRRDGSSLWVRSAVSAVRDGNGRIDGVVAVLIDVSGLHQRDQAIRVAHDRLELALSAGEIGTWDLDIPAGINAFDRRAQHIYGLDTATVTLAEAVGILHPEDKPAAEAAYANACMSGGAEPYGVEYRIRRPGDGRERWIAANGRAFFEHGRPVRLIGVAHDITQRKIAEEQLRLLTREVNHRAKNLLAVVRAVARQTARGNDPAVFAERIEERLAGLAAGQDLLVQSGWQGVAVADLIRAQLAAFADLVDDRIGFAGPPTILNAAAAQAIGMALHELATNAGKYGALSTDAGRVDVSWSIAFDDADDHRFRMCWREAGGPMVVQPIRPGFGHILMVDMVRHGLDAEVELRFEADRVVWRLDCPLGPALEQGRTGA